MRNLVQHAIAPAEVESCLELMAAECLSEGRIGDMRPILLKTAVAVVRAAKTVLNDVRSGTDKDYVGGAIRVAQAFEAYNPRGSRGS